MLERFREYWRKRAMNRLRRNLEGFGYSAEDLQRGEALREALEDLKAEIRKELVDRRGYLFLLGIWVGFFIATIAYMLGL